MTAAIGLRVAVLGMKWGGNGFRLHHPIQNLNQLIGWKLPTNEPGGKPDYFRRFA
jgi:hypothetical protein